VAQSQRETKLQLRQELRCLAPSRKSDSSEKIMGPRSHFADVQACPLETSRLSQDSRGISLVIRSIWATLIRKRNRDAGRLLPLQHLCYRDVFVPYDRYAGRTHHRYTAPQFFSPLGGRDEFRKEIVHRLRAFHSGLPIIRCHWRKANFANGTSCTVINDHFACWYQECLSLQCRTVLRT
jgi:hypothetical protein